MNKLVASLATRGRPGQLLQTVAQNLRCFSRENTVLLLGVDDDDKPTIEALNHATVLDKRVKVNIKPREDTVAGKWNRALEEPADVYLVTADDDPIITPEADAKLLKAAEIYPDGIGMVRGHMTSVSFSSVYGLTAKFVETLGYIQPELFPYWFVDHWTDDLARMIGRETFVDVATDQSKAGKTMELREPAWWATFYDAAYPLRHEEARKIIERPDFATRGWQRQSLLNSFMAVTQRSRWINQNVRAMATQLEGWAGLTLKDERYQRVRTTAVDMLPHLLDEMGTPPGEADIYRKYLLPPKTIVGLKQAYAA